MVSRSNSPRGRRSLQVTGGMLLAGAAAGLSLAPAAGATTTPAPTTPAATASAATQAGSADLPVLGSTTVTANRSSDGVRATALVHGVRRVTGGTVLYFSVGLPAGSPTTRWTSLTNGRQERSLSGSGLGSQQLIDLPNNRAYSVLTGPDQVLASPAKAWPGTAGRFYVMYEVLPELPAGLTSVDVQIGNNDVIQGVPVSDGVMEPAVAQTGPLELGAGWPQIDLAAVQAAVNPKGSINAISLESSDLKRTVVRRSTQGSVTVDLSADVLFAVDSATLSSAARGKIEEAAKQINAGAAAGKVQVVGHTDSQGTSAHNVDLSRRRAQSVEKVLKPLVTVSGVSFVVDGRGETQPVASNSTSDGRRENRRVSVVFTPKESK